MFIPKALVSVFFTALLVPSLVLAQAPAAANDAISKFRDEGMNRSQAMATIRHLTDVIGPRLTGSPNQKRANNWTREQLERWGMKNAAVDPWGEFGRGWELRRFTATFTTPEQSMPFRSFPKAWSPSTNGPISGDVVYVDATDEAGLEKYKGKLKGAIVLAAAERPVQDMFKPTGTRTTDEELSKLENAKLSPAPTPQATPTPNPQQPSPAQFSTRKNRFYFEEGAAVLVDSGTVVDGGAIRVMGASLPPSAPGTQPTAGLRAASKNAPATIPQIVAELEQYNRVLRLVRQGVPVRMTIDLDVRWTEDDLQGYNTIAEIPGTDLANEVVMVGAHLDSWHSGTGATDNAAGVTVVMEAMRIIAATGLKPRRTIRIGLWTGEEQGLLGSRGYVSKYLGSVQNRVLTKKPAHDTFAAYYNLDNGTGQIRGIYLQGNEALRAPFKQWLSNFRDWNATTVTINNTTGTDHLAFDAVGLPGFQFIQDPVEYSTRTWHTTQDVYDRILAEDLKRSAVIMAAFAYNSAMTDQKLARKPEPGATTVGWLTDFDLTNELDKARFNKLGYGLSICGGELGHEELPHGFPTWIAATKELHGHAD
jgi:carboxypeptidase Q